MDHELLLARSITQAQHMVRSLGGCGIRSALMRAPVGLTDRGCGPLPWKNPPLWAGPWPGRHTP